MEQIETLEEKKWFLLRGLGRSYFEIQNGSYKLFNKRFEGYLKIELNSGDSYILFSETKVKINFSPTIHIDPILHNPLPSDWLSLRIEIQPVLNNKILVLGPSDSGKTTLLKYLAYNLPKNNQSVGLIDLDVGQNSLGLPGTINLANFTSTGISLIYSKYFGHISPAGNSNLFLQTVQTFFEKVKTFNYNWLFVDTSGYIQTSEAIAIKNGLLTIIKPQIVLLLGENVKYLDKKLITRNIRYISISSAIEGIKKEKNPEIRRRKRKERFIDYFNNSKNIEVSIENIKSITINYDAEQRVLLIPDEIQYFLGSNIEKLSNLFIEITTTTKERNFYAKLRKISHQSIVLTVPESIDLQEPIEITIGSIILE